MAFWKDRNVLVTGGTGLVGSWLTRFLVDRGANAVLLVRDLLADSLAWEIPGARRNRSPYPFTVVRGELEDFDLLERAVNEYEIDTVFHLGAQTIVGTANRNPRSTFESNIRGTWNILEACRRVSTVRCVVVASSDKAYGEQARLPYDESTPLQGRNPYDVSKSCADLVAQSYFHAYGVPVCVTRCGNFYGPGDLNFNRIVPGTIRSVLRKEAPVIRSDGRFTRDYFYVKDGALAYMHLAEKMAASGGRLSGEAFNFSNEQPMTVLEIVSRVLRLMKGTRLKPVILNQARQEIPHQYLSAEKARKALGWKPAYSLDDGLRETIDWYRGLLSGRRGTTA